MITVVSGMRGQSSEAGGYPDAWAIVRTADGLTFAAGGKKVNAKVNPGADWHHAALVIDRADGALRGYLDGRPAGETSLAGVGPVASSERFVFGQAFKGALDDAQLYTRALTGEQVADLATGD